MSRESLLQWQWADYAQKHRSRANLMLHIVAVPLFQISTIALLYLSFTGHTRALFTAASGIVVSLVTQSRGHAMEPEAPEPFHGLGDFVRRFLAEQWVTFPRFVLSGGWLRNLRAATEP